MPGARPQLTHAGVRCHEVMAGGRKNLRRKRLLATSLTLAPAGGGAAAEQGSQLHRCRGRGMASCQVTTTQQAPKATTMQKERT